VTQVVDGAFEALHAPLHFHIVDCHLAIQVVRGFAKEGHVLVHDDEVLCYFLLLPVDASLQQGEMLLELLELSPKVVLGKLLVLRRTPSSLASSPFLSMLSRKELGCGCYWKKLP
jgi:hypothetical protein